MSSENSRITGRRRLYGITAALVAVSLGASAAVGLALAAGSAATAATSPSSTTQSTNLPTVTSGNGGDSDARSSGS